MTESYFDDRRQQQDFNEFENFRYKNDNDRLGSIRTFNTTNLVPYSPNRPDVKQQQIGLRSQKLAVNAPISIQDFTNNISNDSIRLYITIRKSSEAIVDYRKLIIMIRGIFITIVNVLCLY